MLKYRLKRLPWIGIALSAVILALLPFVASFRFLDFSALATIGETIFPLIGILLLTPLAFGEGGTGQQEVLTIRPTPYWRGFLLRLLMMAGFALICVLAFVCIAAASANAFDMKEMVTGLYVSALLYGSLGLTVGHLSRNQPISYLVPFALFTVEFFTRGQYTGRYFTLSLMNGGLLPEKYILLIIALLLLFLNTALSVCQVRKGALADRLVAMFR